MLNHCYEISVVMTEREITRAAGEETIDGERDPTNITRRDVSRPRSDRSSRVAFLGDWRLHDCAQPVEARRHRQSIFPRDDAWVGRRRSLCGAPRADSLCGVGLSMPLS